jgi:hypothetical protein
VEDGAPALDATCPLFKVSELPSGGRQPGVRQPTSERPGASIRPAILRGWSARTITLPDYEGLHVIRSESSKLRNTLPNGMRALTAKGAPASGANWSGAARGARASARQSAALC